MAWLDYTTVDTEWVPHDAPLIAAKDFEDMADRLDHMESFFNAARAVAIEDMNHKFDSKTDQDGNAWAPWSENYAKEAAAVNINGILERTGALRGAVTSPAAYAIRGDSLWFTGAIPQYGWYHQFGAPDRQAGIPGEGDTADLSDAAIESKFNEAAAANPSVRGLGLSTFMSIQRQSAAEGGGSMADNPLPQRSFIGLTEEAADVITDLFYEWVGGVVIGFHQTASGSFQRRMSGGQFGSGIGL